MYTYSHMRIYVHMCNDTYLSCKFLYTLCVYSYIHSFILIYIIDIHAYLNANFPSLRKIYYYYITYQTPSECIWKTVVSNLSFICISQLYKHRSAVQ